MTISKVMVIGSGQMGSGIAQVFAQAGFTVYLNDIKEEFVKRGLTGIQKQLARSVARERLTQSEAEEIYGRIVPSVDYTDAKDVDLVIEAATENRDIKLSIFKQLDELTPEKTILDSKFNQNLLEEVKRFTKEDLVGRAREFDDEQRFPDDFWEYLTKDLKLFTCLVSDADQPRSFRTFLEALRLISKEYASLASLLLTQGIYVIWSIDRFASLAQKEAYLPDLVSGAKIGAFAFSEPDIRLERDLPQTLARQTDGGWLLDGHKHMVSNASLADICLVYAQTVSLDGSRGLGLFLVETSTEGVSVGPTISKSGMKSLPISPMTFEGVKLAEASLLGAGLDARKCLTEVLVKMRLAISAQSLGIAEGVFKKGLDYSKLKRGFGRRPIDVSVNQLKFSEIAMKLAACEAYYHACIGGDMTDDRQISMLKLLTTETAQEVAEDVVRITGAYSFIADNDIERYVNDAKITGLYGGSTDSLKHNIAQIWLVD